MRSQVSFDADAAPPEIAAAPDAAAPAPETAAPVSEAAAPVPEAAAPVQEAAANVASPANEKSLDQESLEVQNNQNGHTQSLTRSSNSKMGSLLPRDTVIDRRKKKIGTPNLNALSQYQQGAKWYVFRCFWILRFVMCATS